MKRYLEKFILNDLPKKVVLLSGPRQAGKTTLSKNLNDSFDYFNYDFAEHRIALLEKSWDRSKALVIFDEIHKMKEWKRWVKGIYDVEGIPPQLLVTGSAKLNVYRKVGDSLAGRYFQYRLHPLDLKELCQTLSQDKDKVFDCLWRYSGFPEPYLHQSEDFYRRWQYTHLDIILRQDLLDLQSIRDIKSIETLVELLKKRVGSCISYANLARDLQCDAKTVKRYLELLENLFVIFKVTPYSKNLSRSILKEPKYYFYDHTYAESDTGARLENMVACSLLKELNFIEDTTGKDTSLHYLRTKDGKELDFLVLIDEKPTHMLEIKTSDDAPSKNFQYFSAFINPEQQLQLVKDLKREKTYPSGVEVRRLIDWLANLNLS